MTIKELAKKCEERDIKCDGCTYQKECDKFSNMLEDIAPATMLTIMERKIEE